MPPCDPLIYIPITDPDVPVFRTASGIPARDIAPDIAICGELGLGISDVVNPIGSGNGEESTVKISNESCSFRCGYREMVGSILTGGNVFISEDLGSYPKNQYINSSEIVVDLDAANMFTLRLTRLDREYVLLLKSTYHRKSEDGSRDCVGFVRKTAFGDLYYFIDGTTSDALVELPAGRDLELDQIPNYGVFIFENLPVRGKPTTDSIRTIYLMVHNSSDAAGEISMIFEEQFDFNAIGGGSAVVNQFVFPKPIGFSVLKADDALQVEANSYNLYEIKINNPTMYVVDSIYDAECIANYDNIIHSRFSSRLIVTKLS